MTTDDTPVQYRCWASPRCWAVNSSARSRPSFVVPNTVDQWPVRPVLPIGLGVAFTNGGHIPSTTASVTLRCGSDGSQTSAQVYALAGRNEKSASCAQPCPPSCHAPSIPRPQSATLVMSCHVIRPLCPYCPFTFFSTMRRRGFQTTGILCTFAAVGARARGNDLHFGGHRVTPVARLLSLDLRRRLQAAAHPG